MRGIALFLVALHVGLAGTGPVQARLPASSCTTTGMGPGNAATCGGLATSCTTMGLGRGNWAACGGLASGCTSTGVGAGNVTACGGWAAR